MNIYQWNILKTTQSADINSHEPWVSLCSHYYWICGWLATSLFALLNISCVVLALVYQSKQQSFLKRWITKGQNIFCIQYKYSVWFVIKDLIIIHKLKIVLTYICGGINTCKNRFCLIPWLEIFNQWPDISTKLLTQNVSQPSMDFYYEVSKEHS